MKTVSSLHAEISIGALARSQKYLGKAIEALPYVHDPLAKEALTIARAQSECATASARRALELLESSEKKEGEKP